MRASRTAVACALLAGCAGAPTRIHTLEPVAGPAATAWTRPAFRVDAVHLPPALDRPELVRHQGPYRVTLSDTDRWAAPLGELVRRALTQDLAARLPPGTLVLPDAPKPPGCAGLVVDVLSVTIDAEGVRMDASWTWTTPRATGPAAAAAAPRIVSVRAATRGDTADALAPELSELMAKLADEIDKG